jgi:uncharacterized small protein (TIGR04563 family)
VNVKLRDKLRHSVTLQAKLLALFDRFPLLTEERMARDLGCPVWWVTLALRAARRARGKPNHKATKLYLPAETAAEIAAEARRQGRSRAWLLRAAWRIARADLAKEEAA